MFVEVANTLKKVADGVKNINDESAEDKEKTNKEFSPKDVEVSENKETQSSQSSLIDSLLRGNPFGENLAPTDEMKYHMIAGVIDKIDAFNPANWYRLSEDVKVAALQELENASAEISHRPACIIDSRDLGAIEERDGLILGLKGEHIDGHITVNSELLNMNSPEALKEVLDTIIHEGRHEYQTYNVNLLLNGISPTERSFELVNAWHINMNELGYKNGECSFWDIRQIGYKEYLAQPIEVDARVFAENVLDKTVYFA